MTLGKCVNSVDAIFSFLSFHSARQMAFRRPHLSANIDYVVSAASSSLDYIQHVVCFSSEAFSIMKRVKLSSPPPPYQLFPRLLFPFHLSSLGKRSGRWIAADQLHLTKRAPTAPHRRSIIDPARPALVVLYFVFFYISRKRCIIDVCAKELMPIYL
jgi:hypothetical protein